MSFDPSTTLAVLSGTGFPNEFFNDSHGWSAFWRGRPWLAGRWIGRKSLDVGLSRFWVGWVTKRDDKCGDEFGLLLFYDEIHTGFGRTGKMWGYDWSGVKPDVAAIAKGMGGGFPIGAFMATGRRRSVWCRARTARRLAAIRWPPARPTRSWTSCSSPGFSTPCASG